MIKSLLRESGLYALSVFIPKIASLLLFPIYTRYLTPADYGVIELLDVMVNCASILLAIRVSNALLYFLTKSEAPQRDIYISSAFLASMGLTVGVAAFAWRFDRVISETIFRNGHWAMYCRLALIGLGVTLPVEIGLACLRAFGQAVHYLTISVLRLFLSVTLTLSLLCVVQIRILAMLWPPVITGLIFTAYFAWLLLRRRPLHWNLGALTNLFRYALPLSGTTLAMFVLHFADRFFLQRSVSLEELGIYAVAYKIGMLVAHVQSPFNLYWGARVFTILQSDQGDRAYVKICTYFTAYIVFAALLLILFSDTIVHVLSSAPFYPASQLVPWIAVPYVIRAVADFFGSAYFVTAKTHWDAVSSITAAVVCLLGYVVLIPRFKVAGAIAATNAGFFVLMLMNFWLGQRLRRFEFEWWRLLRVIGSAVVAGGVFLMLPALPRILEFAMSMICGAAFLVMLFATGFWTLDEKSALASAVGMLRHDIERVPSSGGSN